MAAVGDEGAPLKGTSDPDILLWCEENNAFLVTNNRASMPAHLADHLSQGRHTPGIFTVKLDVPIHEIVDDLLLAAGASHAGE